MDLGAAGLSEQPFPTHGRPLANISYASKMAAIEMLHDTCAQRFGLSLLQGPPLAGKSMLIREFVQSLSKDCCAAVIDGNGLNTTNLLLAVLRQFGYNIELSSANELLGLVRVFVLQQAAAHESPILIIENTDKLNPSALRALCELAELRVRHASALKLVLVSDRSLSAMLATSALAPISKRVVHDFHLRPMNREETRQYLHAKLHAAGSEYPEFILPDTVCLDIWRASAGWPGIADRVALLALAQTDTLPVSVADIEHPALPGGTWADSAKQDLAPDEHIVPALPRLIVSNNGSVMQDLTMEKPRVLVGRSEHNDISIKSRFVSRHHALLVRHSSATFLMDLNSSNGTFVNSKRVSNHVLVHDDVITIGHHRVKFHDPHAMPGTQVNNAGLDDTVIMKTLDDMRKLLAEENTALLPVATEDVPTVQT